MHLTIFSGLCHLKTGSPVGLPIFPSPRDRGWSLINGGSNNKKEMCMQQLSPWVYSEALWSSYGWEKMSPWKIHTWDALSSVMELMEKILCRRWIPAGQSWSLEVSPWRKDAWTPPPTSLLLVHLDGTFSSSTCPCHHDLIPLEQWSQGCILELLPLWVKSK